MSWIDGPLAGFDTETTGVDPETDRIVSAAVVEYGGVEWESRSRTWLADPGVDIPEGATAVHGITTEEARTSGAPAEMVIREILGTLAAACERGRPLVVMNASYDLTLLEHEAARYGLVSLFQQTVPCVLDPRVLDKQLDRYRPGARRLEDLCRVYGVILSSAHDAREDAIAACAVTRAIVARYPRLASISLGELHEMQVRWAAEQQASLRDYFQRTPGKAELAASVRLEWPAIPAATAPAVVPE